MPHITDVFMHLDMLGNLITEHQLDSQQDRSDHYCLPPHPLAWPAVRIWAEGKPSAACRYFLVRLLVQWVKCMLLRDSEVCRNILVKGQRRKLSVLCISMVCRNSRVHFFPTFELGNKLRKWPHGIMLSKKME